MNYNLLDENWIPVLYHDGRWERIGINSAFLHATRIHGIVQSSPLDHFAIHRFLLTLLYWKADHAGGVQELRSSLLRGDMPAAIVEAIYKESSQFGLFDEIAPFLQDTSITKRKETKSAGSFFAEMATGTNIAHFHHGDDNALRLCLNCVTRGLLRLVPWSQSGGSGITPSIHGAPPIMTLAKGHTLAATLGLNLIPLNAPAGKPQWSGHFEPTNSRQPIPFLEAFTWNPRRILLPRPEEAGLCWGCGAEGIPVVGRVCYQKNDATKKPSKDKPFPWQDPAAFYPTDTPNNPMKSIDHIDGRTTVTGSDLRRLIKQDRLPPCQITTANPEHRGWILAIPCTTGMNAKTFDHRQIVLDTLGPDSVKDLVPPPESRDTEKNGRDGFGLSALETPSPGIRQLILAANRHLTHTDWVILGRAAFRSLHEVPAAFDLFAGIYWPLRRQYVDFPARHTVWLLLKLMATVPETLRANSACAGFCPLSQLPRRQLITPKNGRRASPYPIGLPRGHQMEAALQMAIRANVRKRPPDQFDWAGFCNRLSKLIG